MQPLSYIYPKFLYPVSTVLQATAVVVSVQNAMQIHHCVSNPF